MSRFKRTIILTAAGAVVLAFVVFQLPFVKSRVDWRYEVWSTYLKNAVDPVEKMPTPVPSTPFAISTPLPPTPTLAETEAPTQTPVPLPPQASLPAPKYELQGINNCGPATLAMALRMYGWQGDQNDIAKYIKPVQQDRNVNPDELRRYVLTQAGWLGAEVRVAGDLIRLKSLLSANYPVIIEEQSKLDPSDANGPNDDLWDAHYLLVTGYDDAAGVVTAQDSYHGADLKIPYDKLLEDWKPFNYLYIVLYLKEKDEAEVQSLLGSDWNPDQNRQKALQIAEQETVADKKDAFAWFNLGASLTYFDRYAEAAEAFDNAFTIGLPQRMTRYQFWPFVAYFNADRIDYLLQITENTYKTIPGNYSEEALLWHGYAQLRKADNAGALADWDKALKVHPGYCDAETAIKNYINSQFLYTSGCP
jgi:hypothetical protein